MSVLLDCHHNNNAMEVVVLNVESISVETTVVGTIESGDIH